VTSDKKTSFFKKKRKKKLTVASAVGRNTNVAQTCKRTKEKKRQTN
jgi:hypothetical protein